jgi:hypothetical protein
MNTPKFWPLDFDPEGEIYENLAWDLPGFRTARGIKVRVSKPAQVSLGRSSRPK